MTEAPTRFVDEAFFEADYLLRSATKYGTCIYRTHPNIRPPLFAK